MSTITFFLLSKEHVQPLSLQPICEADFSVLNICFEGSANPEKEKIYMGKSAMDPKTYRSSDPLCMTMMLFLSLGVLKLICLVSCLLNIMSAKLFLNERLHFQVDI